MAIAHWRPALLSQAKSSRAPGNGRIWSRHPPVGLGVLAPQALEPVLAHLDAGFPFELVGEQAAAHPDLAMDAPDREVDALAIERLLPCQHVLIDAVHQRLVEI